MPSANDRDANGQNGSNGHAELVAAWPNVKHSGGRPTAYLPEYCDRLISWFSGRRTERVIRKERTIPSKSGLSATEIEWETIGLGVPTMDGFAASIGYRTNRLHEWCKKHPEFQDAFARARGMQRDWLVELATRNLISAGTYSYTMSNISEWRADPKPTTDSERKAIFFFDPMRDSRAVKQPREETQRVSG